MRVLFCESCGAPLEVPWSERTVACRYCGNAHLSDAGPTVLPPDGRPRVSVGGRTYVLEGLLAHGDAADVFRARWVARLGELVVLKVLRALSDADVARREWDVLSRLQRSDAPGAVHLAKRLPQPIAFGYLDERTVTVWGWRSGFVHTLVDVSRVHPRGVDGKVVAWVFKRLLELLGFVHRSGVVHGAINPAHVLVHPRDHGAVLVGWGTAVRIGEPLPAIPRAFRGLVPVDAREGAPVTPRTDLAMAARVAIDLGGGAGWLSPGGALPGGLGRLVADAASGAFDDAWDLREKLDLEVRAAFGPPSHNPLAMPGW